jgi:quercetin dioxygenase-like cupin family protein
MEPTMDQQTFETQLRADGYTEIEIKSYEPKPANGEHGHHFDVRGLVLDGAFIVIADNQPVTYRPGDIFTVPNGRLHCEEIGPEGARVLIGRRF